MLLFVSVVKRVILHLQKGKNMAKFKGTVVVNTDLL